MKNVVMGFTAAAFIMVAPAFAADKAPAPAPKCEAMKDGKMKCCTKAVDGKMVCEVKDHSKMDHGGMDHSGMKHGQMDHSAH